MIIMGVKHKFCIDCGELALPRYNRCKKCHRDKVNKHIRERYANDKEYRKTHKERSRLAQLKAHEKNPELYAKRQKEFRLNNPEKFNMIMIRTYFKRLTADQKKEIAKELGF